LGRDNAGDVLYISRNMVLFLGSHPKDYLGLERGAGRDTIYELKKIF